MRPWGLSRAKLGGLAPSSGSGHAFLYLPHAPVFGDELQTDPAPGGVFPPVRQISLPACHRLVLILLFQDVVLWLIETEQVKAFRPRRN